MPGVPPTKRRHDVPPELADALEDALDGALSSLTADPLPGTPAESLGDAYARIESAFALCRAEYYDQPWALAQIEALIDRLRQGLANARPTGHVALVPVEDRP